MDQASICIRRCCVEIPICGASCAFRYLLVNTVEYAELFCFWWCGTAMVTFCLVLCRVICIVCHQKKANRLSNLLMPAAGYYQAKISCVWPLFAGQPVRPQLFCIRGCIKKGVNSFAEEGGFIFHSPPTFLPVLLFLQWRLWLWVCVDFKYGRLGIARLVRRDTRFCSIHHCVLCWVRGLTRFCRLSFVANPVGQPGTTLSTTSLTRTHTSLSFQATILGRGVHGYPAAANNRVSG